MISRVLTTLIPRPRPLRGDSPDAAVLSFSVLDLTGRCARASLHLWLAIAPHLSFLRNLSFLPTRVCLMPYRAETVRLDEIPATACPCGSARRAFADRADLPATVHLTEVSRAARVHYHRRQTEVYVVLECSEGAAIELDGVATPVSPCTAVLIPPGVRHRGVGEMKVLIYCTPKFDPADEFFDPGD